MKTRIMEHGRCEVSGVHPKHIYPIGITDGDGYVLLGECYGKYSNCDNCDDVGCMSCVSRESHGECKWNCPNCQKGDAEKLSKTFEDEDNETPVESLHKRGRDIAYNYANGFMNYKTFKKNILEVFGEISSECSCEEDECCGVCGHAPMLHKKCFLR